MSIIIELENVSFSYGSTKAVNKISANINNGVYGLLGPNGAGKTTLMKILLGFLKPQEGSGKVLGYDMLSKKPIVREKIGYMSERDSIIPGMNGVEFTSYLGRLSGMPLQESIKRAHEVLYYVGLEESRYRNVETYSAGMIQRLKLASALVHDPTLLFLDEPTSGMDPKSRNEMLDLINDISSKGKMNIIISSHILTDIEQTCKNVIIMNKGEFIAEEEVDKIKNRDMNIYEMKIVGNRENFLKKFSEFIAGEDYKGVIKMHLPPGFSSSLFFKTAIETGTQIRHFLKKRSTLEEIFLLAIGEQDAN